MSRPSGNHDVLGEILSQPEIWRNTLALVRNHGGMGRSASLLERPGGVVLAGCGSSYYLSLAIAPLWSKGSEMPVRAISATDLLTYPEGYLNGRMPGTLVAVSRSGKTPEICEVARHARENLGWKTIALTCYGDRPLAGICDEAIVLAEAAENSRFTTRALTSMILTLELLHARRAQDERLEQELRQLPEQLERLLARYRGAIQEIAEQGVYKDYVYLGQGPYLGIASELMLKVKEMACAPAEVYSSMEYFHGPRYSATASTLAVVLLSDGGYHHQMGLLQRLRSLKAGILVVCEKASEAIEANADFVVELNSGLSDYGRMLLTMPILQLFAYHRAIVAGKSEWIEQMVYSPGAAAQ